MGQPSNLATWTTPQQKPLTILDVCNSQLARLKELMLDGSIDEDTYTEGCKMAFELMNRTFVIPNEEQEANSG